MFKILILQTQLLANDFHFISSTIKWRMEMENMLKRQQSDQMFVLVLNLNIVRQEQHWKYNTC